MIDTQAPLSLSSSKIIALSMVSAALELMTFQPTGGQLLVLDLLSVHLIRSTEGSTIISYHPSLPLPTTTAKDLHQRIRFAGMSRSYRCANNGRSKIYVTKNRSKCLLAKNVSEVARSDICTTHLPMACHVRLGRGARKPVHSYLYTRTSSF